jgi:hypothetical protein
MTAEAGTGSGPRSGLGGPALTEESSTVERANASAAPQGSL